MHSEAAGSQALDVRRYRIIDILGQGGFGKVYRARLEGPEGFVKDVAIKLLTLHDPSPDDLQRFRDEARILGLIRDRNIVSVDPPTRLGGKWAVVMEFVDGVSCEHIIVNNGPLPLGVVLEITEEVARTLENLFNHPGDDGQVLSLLHRDIKPSNIQITPNGQVKILDFGIARATFGAREAETTAHIGGTKGYIAPERLEGIESPKGDIFSLGMVVHKLLTGKLPKMGEPVNERSVPGGERVKLEALKMAERMRSINPEDRPNAKQVERMCRMLREAAGGEDLREWASRNVPRSYKLKPDGLVGKTLTETLSGIPRMPKGIPFDLRSIEHQSEPHIERPAGAPWGLMLVLVAAGFILVGACFALVLAVAAYRNPSLVGREATAVAASTPTRSLGEVLSDGQAQPVVQGVPEPVPPAPQLGDTGEAETTGPDGVTVEKAGTASATASSEPKPSVAPSVVPNSSGGTASAAPRPGPVPIPVPQVISRTDDGTTQQEIVSVPVPVVSPQPVRPVPVADVATGMVKMAGGALALHLVKDGRVFPPGKVPEGTYALMATFSSGRIEAGRVTVQAGSNITIRCVEDKRVCSPI